MAKYLISIVLFFVLCANSQLYAQEEKIKLINLKTGYSVKGKIIEQSAQGVKILTASGDIFEYRSDEINDITDSPSSTNQSSFFSSAKVVPQIIAKGDKYLCAGFGIIKQLPNNNSAKLSFPLIPVSFEYIVNDDLFNRKGSLGVGGFIGYSAASEKNDYWKYKSSRLIIGARGYLHYALVKKLDTYTGVLLGFKSDVNSISYTDKNSYNDDYKDNAGSPTLNIFAGCRYFFNDKIGGMAELGWGMSIVTIGLAVKL